MTDASPPKPSPPPEPLPIPNLGVPETMNEPFPLIAKLIRLIRRQ